MELTVGSCVAGHQIKKILYKSSTGGMVCSAYKIAEHEETDNLAACKILSDILGWTCILLPRSYQMKVKSADMLDEPMT